VRSWFFLFSCNLMWALQFTCIKLVQDQVGSLFTVWAPMTLATIMLYPLVRAERGKSPVLSGRSGKDILLFLTLSVLGAFPAQILLTWGTRLSLASNAALLMLTIPVCTAVLAHFLLGEKMTGIRWFSFALAIMGVLLCSNFNFGNLNFGKGYTLGNLLIFSGAVGSSFYNSYGKRALERYSPMETLFYTYLTTFFLVTPLVVHSERDVIGRVAHFTLQTWIGLAALTIFVNFLSMVLFLTALKRLDSIQAAVCNYLVTFFGLPIAAVWLGERLTFMAIIGGALVLASTLAITVWDELRKPTPVTQRTSYHSL